MFKKLKAKIEEGGDSGIENVSFSQRKLPGSAVRTLSTDSAKEKLDVSLPSRSPSPASRDGDQEEGIAVPPQNSLTVNSMSDGFPSHITAKPQLTYEALLEARIKQQEADCSSLREQLSQRELAHELELEKLTRRADTVDADRTELKLQVVELQLEKSALENRLSEQERRWAVRERQTKEEREGERKQYEDRIHTLEEAVKEKDKELVERGTELSELKSKSSHLQSRLSAFEESSESEVVKRLQSEVADLEKIIRSRNLDIQILERRLAHQAKGSQEEYGAVVNKQFSLESNYKELATQLDQRRQESKKLVRELERETKVVCDKEREVAQLQAQLTQQELKHNQLIEKLEEMRSNHERHIAEVEGLVEEKDERISELLTNLKQLRGNSGSAHLPDGSVVVASVGGLRPPGLARRTATIGVQTSEELFNDNSEPAVLPLNESVGGANPVLTNGERATMMSLGPAEELTLLRDTQLRLEEEVAEKNKIIKVQQQKILDMKKTLTKELQRSQSTPDVPSMRVDRSPSPPPHRITADVNFQYLKYVVLKFISSREDESSQLIRAISTLLEFSAQEEKYVRDYLDYRKSWFGSVPPPLTPSLAKK